MKPRQQRMLAVGLAALGVVIAAAFTLRAFQDNMMFYVEISDVVQGNVPDERKFRVGGLVVPNSIVRESGELAVKFTVTDTKNSLDVHYDGILPDLFREGQGIIAHGSLDENGQFQADTVLAKHDEKYMPPEVADSLAKHAAEKEAATVVDE
ncbi:MAG: cytochrome c maturation protein CcmE [Gammaproteobacteria bacterium]|nr:cytochrome c maturation protein CcmE [Gammaproteobacteria bacterium]